MTLPSPIPIQSPSTYLPPIKTLPQALESPELIRGYLEYLCRVYTPRVRGSRRRRRVGVTMGFKSVGGSGSGNGNGHGGSEDETLRKVYAADSFERTYALRWLTALIRLLSSSTDSDSQGILSTAASLLALCSGTSAAGTVVRSYDFLLGSTTPTPTSITVTLTDAPLENGDFGSVGSQTWGGACVLAEEITRDPGKFFPSEAEAEKFRVLELGAGTGLVSLTAAKVAEVLLLFPRITFIATDYYPSVLTNLGNNIRNNFALPSISARFLDWASFDDDEDSGDMEMPFDLVLGADIIYESTHAVWIRACLERLLRKPSDTNAELEPESESEPRRPAMFHLVIPLRRLFEEESRTVESVFRFGDSCTQGEDELELVIYSKEFIECDADADGDAEGGIEIGSVEEGEVVRYAYYVIGWGRPRV